MKFTSWLPFTLALPLCFSANRALAVNATINVQADSVVRTLDPRFYGVNTPASDTQFSSAATGTLVDAAKFESLRFPGGYWSDNYNWATGVTLSDNTDVLPVNIASFAKFAEQHGDTPFVTVNYGSETPECAAALVAYLNATASSTVTIGTDSRGIDWKSGSFWAALRSASPLATDDGLNFLRIAHTAPFAVTQFELGSEMYDTHELDAHGVANSGLTGTAHDPYTYAQAYVVFRTKMQAVDPTIQLGANAARGQAIGTSTHTVTNPRTSAVHNDWDAVLLGTLKTLGVTPDFLTTQYYAQTAGAESDATLLQEGAAYQQSATTLRQELSDYLGASGAGVQISLTELNSVFSNPGKQTANLVNGLFYADIYGSLAQTEYNTAIWWDLRYGDSGKTGNNDASSLYGWRDFGTYNMIGDVNFANAFPDNTPLPAYYAAKLLANWARGGDSIVTTTSDNNLLSAYGATLADGSVAILVVNKSPTADLPANISINGAAINGSGTVYTYGKVNDAQSSPTPDITSSSLTGFTSGASHVFPSYSMTVIRFGTSSSKMVNISTRSPALSGDGVQIAGFVITGTSAKTVLIRANGPALVKYNVAGAMADPSLELHQVIDKVDTVLASNDNWGSDPTAKAQIAAAVAEVGAQPWADGSKDAAILTVLQPGIYSAVVNGTGGSTGIDLIEVYEVDKTNTASHLANISTRSTVGQLDNVQIAGFVITGNTPKKVVIRANGPALAPYLNPGTALSDPTLVLQNLSGSVLATNDNWDASDAADFAKVGAAPWTAGSKDAAIVTTLPPGQYTATVSGVGSATGVALVEVYDEQ